MLGGGPSPFQQRWTGVTTLAVILLLGILAYWISPAATGLLALEELADKLHASNRTMLLCGAMAQPAQLMHQAEFEQHIGRENICANIQHALARADQLFRAGPLATVKSSSSSAAKA